MYSTITVHLQVSGHCKCLAGVEGEKCCSCRDEFWGFTPGSGTEPAIEGCRGMPRYHGPRLLWMPLIFHAFAELHPEGKALLFVLPSLYTAGCTFSACFL